MIVQLRGGSGSGKSTVVRQLLREHNGRVVETRDFFYDLSRGKRAGERNRKRIDLWRCDGDLHVLGSYDLASTSGAGGDAVSGPVGLTILRHYLPRYPHLIWEGLFASAESPRGERLDLLREHGVMWATLNTPFDVCVENIKRRRVERATSVDKPLNVAKLQETYGYINRYVDEAYAAGIPCRDVPHESPYLYVHDLLAAGGWACPGGCSAQTEEAR